MVPLLVASLRRSLMCCINLFACLRHPPRQGVVQVHEIPAACASTDTLPSGGIVDSVVDGSVSRDRRGATQ